MIYLLYSERLALLLAIALHDSTLHFAVPTSISNRLTAMPGLKRKNEATASATDSGDGNPNVKDNGDQCFPRLVYTAD